MSPGSRWPRPGSRAPCSAAAVGQASASAPKCQRLLIDVQDPLRNGYPEKANRAWAAALGPGTSAALARTARAMGLRPEQVRVLPTDGRWRLAPDTVAAAVRADRGAGDRRCSAENAFQLRHAAWR